jgi:hypothetical protein
MHMGQSTGPMYGGPVQRRPAPYPNPMYMANKRQQQPGMFHPGMNQVNWLISKFHAICLTNMFFDHNIQMLQQIYVCLTLTDSLSQEFFFILNIKLFLWHQCNCIKLFYGVFLNTDVSFSANVGVKETKNNNLWHQLQLFAQKKDLLRQLWKGQLFADREKILLNKHLNKN